LTDRSVRRSMAGWVASLTPDAFEFFDSDGLLSAEPRSG
jgi:hypothetical protein